MGNEHLHQQVPPLTKPTWREYIPLLVIIGYVVGSVAVLLKFKGFYLLNALDSLMGFFFIYFSLLKLINLSGFAVGYLEYDQITKKWPFWGYIYPFVELGLGVLFLLGVSLLKINIFVLGLMIINSVGVFKKLRAHEAVHCACLGTVIQVPLTTVSLIENVAMGVMAVVSIILLKA